MTLYISGSQRWKHGGPPKTSVNIYAAHHALLRIYFDYLRPFIILIELKFAHFVVFGCFRSLFPSKCVQKCYIIKCSF